MWNEISIYVEPDAFRDQGDQGDVFLIQARYEDIPTTAIGLRIRVWSDVHSYYPS